MTCETIVSTFQAEVSALDYAVEFLISLKLQTAASSRLFHRQPEKGCDTQKKTIAELND